MLSSYILDSGQKFIKNVIHTTIGKRLLKKTWFHSTAKSEYKECKSLIKGWEGFVAPNVIALPETLIEKAENDIFTIIFMSRIHPKKGLELLFDAIARLDFQVRLKIAGTGNQEYVNKLKSLVSDLGIQSQVEWLGWVDREDKFKLLMRSDLFALISYNENFANVVIESLHVGTPVLVSYGVALSEFVSQYDMGWVTSLDIETVVSTIKAAYFDEAKRSVINNTASALIAKQFATKTVIRSYISNYQKIIDSSDDPHYHFNTKPLPIEDNL
jgi:glycosyltransferase involved in cell wall biosynthesis